MHLILSNMNRTCPTPNGNQRDVCNTITEGICAYRAVGYAREVCKEQGREESYSQKMFATARSWGRGHGDGGLGLRGGGSNVGGIDGRERV